MEEPKPEGCVIQWLIRSRTIFTSIYDSAQEARRLAQAIGWRFSANDPWQKMSTCPIPENEAWIELSKRFEECDPLTVLDPPDEELKAKLKEWSLRKRKRRKKSVASWPTSPAPDSPSDPESPADSSSPEESPLLNSPDESEP